MAKVKAKRRRGAAAELGATRAWPGGYARRTADGREVFYIHKRVAGRRWKKALPVATEAEALDELARFRSDPAAYVRGESLRIDDGPLYLSPDLIAAYVAHASAPRSEGGGANSGKWLAEKRKHLAWWATVLCDGEGRALDLRRVDLARHVLPALEEVGGKRHRREAIKAIYAWLAKTGRIKAHEDPVVRLPVGQGGVSQTKGKSKVVPREDVHRVIDRLLVGKGSRYGHALVVSAATGWHVTEIERFVTKGEIIEPVPVALREPGVVAILSAPHKSGRTHYTKVGPDALRSAKALLAGERGFSRRHYDAAVRGACKALGVTKFTPAWMRHTAATHAVQQPGVSDSDAGKFLGHADAKMVHNVYGPIRTPPKVPTIMDELGPVAKPEPGIGELVEEVRRLRAEVAALKRGGKKKAKAR